MYLSIYTCRSKGQKIQQTVKSKSKSKATNSIFRLLWLQKEKTVQVTHQCLTVCSSVPRRLIISEINFLNLDFQLSNFLTKPNSCAFSEKIPFKAYLPYLQFFIIMACNWQYTPITVISTSMHLTDILWSSNNKWLFAWHLLLSDSKLAGIGRLRGSSQRRPLLQTMKDLQRNTGVERRSCTKGWSCWAEKVVLPTQEIHSTSNLQTVFY